MSTDSQPFDFRTLLSQPAPRPTIALYHRAWDFILAIGYVLLLLVGWPLTGLVKVGLGPHSIYWPSRPWLGFGPYYEVLSYRATLFGLTVGGFVMEGLFGYLTYHQSWWAIAPAAAFWLLSLWRLVCHIFYDDDEPYRQVDAFSAKRSNKLQEFLVWPWVMLGEWIFDDLPAWLGGESPYFFGFDGKTARWTILCAAVGVLAEVVLAFCGLFALLHGISLLAVTFGDEPLHHLPSLTFIGWSAGIAALFYVIAEMIVQVLGAFGLSALTYPRPFWD